MIRLLSRLGWSGLLLNLFGLWLPSVGSANENLNVDAGYLRATASTALTAAAADHGTAGSLLLLIAAGGNNGTTFSNNTVPAGQYVTGGDVVLSADSFNTLGDFGTVTGSGHDTKDTFTILTSIYTNNPGIAGAYLELRWYPGLTLAQYNSGITPTGGMTFGAYNPKIYGNASLAPDGGVNWTVPGDGGTTVSPVNFFTTDDQSGSQAVSEGYGNTFVPEPSIYATMLTSAMAGVAVWCQRRRRAITGF